MTGDGDGGVPHGENGDENDSVEDENKTFMVPISRATT